MATKTTINFDDEMEAALDELAAIDGTKRLAIKRSLLAEVKRRRRSQAILDLIASWEAEDGPIDAEHLAWADAVLDRQGVGSVIVDAGPFIVDGEQVNSRLWALIKRATERGDDLHTTHPVLAQVWRDPTRQANLARALRSFDIHPLDESRSVGRRLAATGTSDVVDAHLAVVAQSLGTFILTGDPDDMALLDARFEVY
ncbi:MAG: hypothetical protein IPH81_07025 [Candidatus Microthrix sp.]|nr:hypothetical protein [Candidatus Microthrix sp.]